MHDLMIDDIRARAAFGLRKYGQPLRPFNGRDSLRDAYEEVLDLAVYLRQLCYEHKPDVEMSSMTRSEVLGACASAAAAERRACIKVIKDFDGITENGALALIKLLEQRGSNETA